MPRGGARPGAGRPPNLFKRQQKREEAEAEARNLAAALTVPPRKAGQKSAVEIMREVSNALYGMAARYQPRPDPNDPTKTVGDPEKFRAFATDAATVAGKLAPFEGPTFASIRMTQTPPDLSKLTDEELAIYEQLALKAAGDAGGDTGGARQTVN